MKKIFLIHISFFCCLLLSAGTVDKVLLNSGSPLVDWRISPSDAVSRDEILTSSYDMSSWVKAVVPGATFTSYVEAGLEPDPDFGANAYNVDKSKYAKDMWYRTEISTDSFPEGVCRWLCFEGINRKGEVYFNGCLLGVLDGFMNRGKFDVSSLLRHDGTPNVLAVLVHVPEAPVPNYESPTYISSDGWDWMPSVPGLLGGITDDVYLSASGSVTLEDVWVRTKVPSRDEGVISVSTEIAVNGEMPEKILIKGVISPGGVTFEKEFETGRFRGRMLKSPVVEFTEDEFPQLKIMNPRLWWPNGYGDQNLYECTLSCEIDGVESDVSTVTFGIREYSYDYVKDVFRISCNGENIYCKGGNWGMSEYMLRCRGEEYDLKVRLHKEMNFNMIRNWIGSTTDDEFYEACDKYGIMVFDDFWLNSHPNLPTDVFAFNHNAVEKIKRLRNHPCIAVWCGDNEGVPQPPLNEWLREDVKVYDGGDRWYQPISREYGLSGSGPWVNAHPIWYFTKYPLGFGEHKLDGWGFRTEIGTAVFVNYESLKKFMPDAEQWPLDNDMLEKHFFGRSSFNSRPDRYFSTVEYNYGKAEGTEDFCRKSQLLNYEVNKAMYEGWQHHLWNDAAGILTWMSQSAYPSLVWQTYDYYYDLNGAYWGVKDACEHVHVQWSYADNSVKTVNTTDTDYNDLTAEAHVYNLDGSEVRGFSKTGAASALSNSACHVMTLDFPEDDNLARGKKVYVSSFGAKDYLGASALTDGNTGSAWSAVRGAEPWAYVDLGEPMQFSRVVLSWESGVCEDYEIMVSDDADKWTVIHSHGQPSSPIDAVDFSPVTARYVKVAGKTLPRRNMAMQEIEIYNGAEPETGVLSPVHFIRLKMKDKAGKVLSENFYWRSLRLGDYTALNELGAAQIRVKTSEKKMDGKLYVTADISNKGNNVAFGIRVIPVHASSGEQIVPAVMDAGYFTLLPGEARKVTVELDEDLLQDDGYRMVARPYND